MSFSHVSNLNFRMRLIPIVYLYVFQNAFDTHCISICIYMYVYRVFVWHFAHNYSEASVLPIPPMVSPRFHVSANANVIHKRKRNHHQTLSVIMSSVFPCNRFNYTAKTIILVANNSVKIIAKTVCFYFTL